MKKILIISFYFPPYNGIEGNRVYSWAKEFKKHGLYPVVVTRHWEGGKPQSWGEYIAPFEKDMEVEITEAYTVYRVSHRHKASFNRNDTSRIAGLRYWLEKTKGNFHIETDTYTSFYKACVTILNQEQFHYLLVSSPPLNVIRLGYELATKFNLSFCVDFRDTYNNDYLQEKPDIPMFTRFEAFLFRGYLRKWLKRASLITSVSAPALALLNQLHSNKSCVIYNGYESELFQGFSRQPADSKKFTISILGNLYPKQDIDFMIKGFNAFLNEKSDVIIQFIGTGTNKFVREKITQSFLADQIVFTDRIDRLQALTMAARSHVLYYIGWKGFKGIYSGKIFEYLGLRRIILLAPSDNDVIEELIQQTESGYCCDTVEDMYTVLSRIYQEWKSTCNIRYRGATTVMEEFTREAQAAKLSAQILGLTTYSQLK